MPPKGSSSKRKAKQVDKEEDIETNSEGEQGNSKASKPKKAKTSKGPVIPLDPSLPINTTFPIDVSLPPKPEGTIRLSNWNVCGINSAMKKVGILCKPQICRS